MSSQTVRPIMIKTVALFYISWSPSLPTSFVAFIVFWTYLVQKLSFSIRSKKLAMMEVKTFQPTKIEKQPLLYLMLADQASNFYHEFYNGLEIFSPKMEMLS